MGAVKRNYKVYVFCENCGVHEDMVIDKGKAVQSLECNNCGCTGFLKRDTGKKRSYSYNDRLYTIDNRAKSVRF